MTRYITLVSLWGVWCFFHSFMINRTVTGFVRKHFKNTNRYYRIFYNIFAVVTLIPVWFYGIRIKGTPVFLWEGPFRITQGIFVLLALLFFIGGARRYDLTQFLGIRQIKENNPCPILTDDCRLDTGGILGVVRHPWYTGGIIVVWARNLDTATILTNLVITLYLIIGVLLEERKLVAEFRGEYIDYQRRVSMLFPFKWMMQKLT